MAYLLTKPDNFTTVGSSIKFREKRAATRYLWFFVEYENGTGWTADISTLVLKSRPIRHFYAVPPLPFRCSRRNNTIPLPGLTAKEWR
jgi:hypothetical protein